MAGKGGGAWKVAYADFVTAMMAFFLVMWLVAQDQKVKESIAHYFQNPVGVNLLGDSSRHDQSGGMFYSEVHGPVPNQTSRTAGRSIGTFDNPRLNEDETLIIAEWVLQEPRLSAHWQKMADETLGQAERSLAVQGGEVSVEETARRILSHQMRVEMLASAEHISDPVLHDVISLTLSKVDWAAIAEECLLRSPARR